MTHAQLSSGAKQINIQLESLFALCNVQPLDQLLTWFCCCCQQTRDRLGAAESAAADARAGAAALQQQLEEANAQVGLIIHCKLIERLHSLLLTALCLCQTMYDLFSGGPGSWT